MSTLVTLAVDGNKYTGWTSIEVFRSVETICGDFTFTATTQNQVLFPVGAGQACQVFIGSNMVANGYVDEVSVSYADKSHTISVKGRDRTADLVDGTIIGVKEYQNMGLIQVINTVLKNTKLTAISVTNLAGDINAVFPDNDPAATPISQTIFNFIETFARKRQVLISNDGKGNILLLRAPTGTMNAVIQNIVNGGNANNIKSATVKYDFKKRFNKYTIQSAQNPGAMGDIVADTSASSDDAAPPPDDEPATEDETGSNDDYGEGDPPVDNEAVAVQTGTATDPTIRESRVTEVIARTCNADVDLDELAQWTMQLARARSTEYEAVVVGHYGDAGNTQLWTPNFLVKVTDDFAKINATMLIKSVCYKVSVETGTTTNICLVDSDSYVLQLEEESDTNKKKRKANTIGGDLVWTAPNGTEKTVQQ